MVAPLTMDLNFLIDELGYRDTPGLLDPASADCPPGLAHLFRRAHNDCNVRAVYALRSAHGNTAIPLVYLAEADSEDEAQIIHRKVWNQNLVPFLVVSTPNRYVLYPGFSYRPDARKPEIAHILKSARVSLDEFQGLDARSIADGSIWTHRSRDVDLEARVDWTLLAELEKLGDSLRGPPIGLSIHQAHALIGKYVFLRYLSDRGILSKDRLEEWDIRPEEVFGRNATLDGFAAVNGKLDAWLNGSVFPVAAGPDGVSEAAIRKTAAVFDGDLLDGQLSLFKAYDFAFIPIETLSVIYQQFLHAEDRGRSKGAYYTPVNLVDLILDEVETRCPLLPGTMVLDPACGSGAFLVQAYRRMIERQLRAAGKIRPNELRSLLTQNIHGVDQDEDACRVAALSLVLTLLDYVEPPDLLRYPTFKLPTVYGNNIFQGDFFDDTLALCDKRYHCIVGNPPWLEIKPNNPATDHKLALKWMRGHSQEYPVGGWQLAEAFAWKVGEHLRPGGAVGLLLPAMTLFKVQSKNFRAKYFSQFQVWCVANFANLAYVLFGGRSKVPAVALFYRAGEADENPGEDILTYSPFLANQPAMQQGSGRGFKESWLLTVNGGELRQVPTAEAMHGEGLTWKLAMWGSHRDRRLLARVSRRFPTFQDFRVTHGLRAHQGVELREKNAGESVEYVAELVGKRRIIPTKLGRQGRLYGFPDQALEVIRPEQAYVRKGRVKTPLSICTPPHLVLGRSREWAIYSDDFLVVPPRQLGIAGAPGQDTLLKALALYLCSDFVRYHQLFHAAEMGVQGSVADKANVEDMPMPLAALSDQTLSAWAEIYDRLAECWRQSQTAILEDWQAPLRDLEREANDLVFESLGLSVNERWLVEDLVHGRLELIQGKLGDGVSECPNPNDLQAYGESLRQTLDDFMDGRRHQVDIAFSGKTGIVVITLGEASIESKPVGVQPADGALSEELAALSQRLIREHAHWLYFERGLTLFHGKRIYLVKPMQRLHWLRSQALLDADSLIADMLAGGVPRP